MPSLMPIKGFWSIFKRGIVGTFHKVGKKYLHLYVAEFQFWYNNRFERRHFRNGNSGMLNRKAVLFFALMLLAFDFSYSLLSTCQPIRQLASSHVGEQSHCSPFAGIFFEFFVFAIAEWLKAYEHELIAGFTIVLAFSTILLWWSTSKLWQSTNDAVTLAKEEFTATHRPNVIVHAVEFRRNPVENRSSETDDYDRIGASLLCFNIGESVALNVEARGQIFGGSSFGVDVQRPLVKTVGEVLNGQKLRIEIKSDWQVREMTARIHQGIDYFCIGTISYFDENEQRRETGFCFRLITPVQGERWKSAEKPEYEYAY